MEEVILEILGRTGKVKERHRLAELPATVGRGYGNHVVVDDPYVSPLHLRLERGEDGRVAVRDLGSANGTVLLPAAAKIDRLVLGPETLLRLGHTTLRLRDAAFAVPEAQPLAGGIESFMARLDSGRLLALVLPLTLLAAALDGYFSSFDDAEIMSLVFVLVVVLVGGGVWVSLWALASRGMAGRSYFFAHCTVACLGLLGLSLVDSGTSLFSFAFALEEAVSWGRALAAAGCLGLLFFCHLGVASLMRHRSVLGLSIVLALVLTLLFEPDLFFDDWQDPGQIPVSLPIWPSGLQMVASEDTASFFGAATELRARLDDERRVREEEEP